MQKSDRKTTQPLQVAAAVIRRDQHILIARRPPGDRLAGLWEFPGGKLELGESPQQCLARELQEELALDCQIGAHIVTVRHAYPHITIDLIVHEAYSTHGEARALVHDAISWITCAELERYTFADADRPVVALLIKSLTSA